jgi:uncharacterized protein (TIGR02246 family)
MDAATQLLELEAIKRLKARYFRCMDTKDWDAWAQVFTEDATLEFDLAVSTLGRPGNPAPRLAGRDAIVRQVSRDLATTETVHHGHMPEIELLSDTQARGIWAMEDIVDYGGHNVIRGFGHYHETYAKRDGQWRISSVHLTRIRMVQTLSGHIVAG